MHTTDRLPNFAEKKRPMPKQETIHNGYELTIYRTIRQDKFSGKQEFTVSNLNHNPVVHDEMKFTESQWAELKEFFRKDFDGILYKPFSEFEIEQEFRPRFGGINPDFLDIGRCIWRQAFEYVNQKLRR